MSIKTSITLDSLTLNDEGSKNTDAVRLSQLNALQTSLENKINTDIANLVDGAPEALNTLNELSQALDNDANASATLIGLVSTETARATAAETDLSQRLQSETDRALAAELINTQSIQTEVARASAAENSLAASLSAEETRAQAAEQVNADTWLRLRVPWRLRR